MRKSIRKRHIVALLAITVVSFIAFFSVLPWGFTWHDGTQSLTPYHAALRLLAALVVGRGATIGYSFILKNMGLASPEDDERRLHAVEANSAA